LALLRPVVVVVHVVTKGVFKSVHLSDHLQILISKEQSQKC